MLFAKTSVNDSNVAPQTVIRQRRSCHLGIKISCELGGVAGYISFLALLDVRVNFRANCC